MARVGMKIRSGTLAVELREELMKIPAMAIRLREWDTLEQRRLSWDDIHVHEAVPFGRGQK